MVVLVRGVPVKGGPSGGRKGGDLGGAFMWSGLRDTDHKSHGTLVDALCRCQVDTLAHVWYVGNAMHLVGKSSCLLPFLRSTFDAFSLATRGAQ